MNCKLRSRTYSPLLSVPLVFLLLVQLISIVNGAACGSGNTDQYCTTASETGCIGAGRIAIDDSSTCEKAGSLLSLEGTLTILSGTDDTNSETLCPKGCSYSLSESRLFLSLWIRSLSAGTGTCSGKNVDVVLCRYTKLPESDGSFANNGPFKLPRQP